MTTLEDGIEWHRSRRKPNMYVSDNRHLLCSSCPLLFFWSRHESEMEHFRWASNQGQLLLLTKHLLTWCSRPCGFVAGRHQGAALCGEVCLDCWEA